RIRLSTAERRFFLWLGAKIQIRARSVLAQRSRELVPLGATRELREAAQAPRATGSARWGVRFGSRPNLRRERSMCLRISMSRSFGGAVVTHPRTRRSADAATSSIVRLKRSSFALDGLFAPLTFRTNCSAEARISAMVAGGSKFASVRMFRHMRTL